ncbi:calcium-activated potassium channel subunit beta-3 isoform X2 [Monodelphis domestica]|uniref:calcium-activated potassium channel subunit beta-3 isoform X2 n=1 Tax=Monodelphis domestica TaxID=13616 RepID=UPI0024E262EC|nr:calcium-activated potassium channel subunit beta-3 isoform X2 [Monodelphis domestica]
MQPFIVPVQITLQGGRRRQGRSGCSASERWKKKDRGDGGSAADVPRKPPSSAGEDRAILLGFVMMGFSVLMFFLLGVTILKPFLLSTQREEANCTIMDTRVKDDWLDCSFTCGVDCRGQGKYPCLQVSVNLSHSGQKAFLHYNEEAVQINPECFYTPKCHRDRNDLLSSALDIKEFFDHKNGTPFSCFYSPDGKPEDVVLIRKYDHTVVFHCVFWPSLTLLGGALIVGMVKLTQHLSVLCDEYAHVAREDAGKAASQKELRPHRLWRKGREKGRKPGLSGGWPS